jgi:formamidase
MQEAVMSDDRGFASRGVSRFRTRDLSTPRFRCEVGVRLAQQPGLGHNRWHPRIEPLVEVDPGDEVILESPGYDDYQLQDDDSLGDVESIDLSRTHPLAGPVSVRGAEPGDLLVVDLLELSPLSGVGYSCVIPQIGGILRDVFPGGFKSVWYMRGNAYAESRHVPGIRIPALPHPGVLGVAPSVELLAMWNRREAPLVEAGTAYGPDPATAILRGNEDANDLRDAARTVPPRENGGNVDIKDLSLGSRAYFPVFVEGALLSVGDLHFAEGDGEATWNAIEMDGVTWLRLDLIKGGASRYRVSTPVFQPGPFKPDFGNRYLTFTGFCFSGDHQASNDCTFATREAMLRAIDYLMEFGYSGEQAYTILSVAPIEVRVAGIVDVPNACVTLSLPVDIFDRDLLPRTLTQ